MKPPDAAQDPQARGSAAAWPFFRLVFALSVPFYLVGLTGWRLPGLPMLPLGALMGLVPMIAALILAGRSGRGSSIRRLPARLFDPISLTGVAWLCVATLIMPLVCLIEYALLVQGGAALPAFGLDPATVLFLFTAFFIGAIGEELGWQGHAYGALRRDHSPLGAALVIGVVWAAWHILPFIELGREGAWIFWHSLNAVALRIIIVWLFEAAGRRLLIAVVFHTMINVSWAVFPDQGSAYDPLVTFLILAPMAAGIALVWRPGTRRTPDADRTGQRTGGGR